jgi:hypothetical protein
MTAQHINPILYMHQFPDKTTQSTKQSSGSFDIQASLQAQANL